jgi:hypothetical protein
MQLVIPICWGVSCSRLARCKGECDLARMRCSAAVEAIATTICHIILYYIILVESNQTTIVAGFSAMYAVIFSVTNFSS